MAEYKTIELTQPKTGVLSIALNRPEARNALNEEVFQDLVHVFQTEVKASEVRVIVLQGNGPVFCAGGDLKWLKRAATYSYEQNMQETRSLAKFYSYLNEFPKPLVGVVHGAVMGGGIGLACTCDMVLAEENTTFCFSETRLGLVPAVIAPFVIAKIGASQTRRLFITAQPFNAKQAKGFGLVHECFPSQDTLKNSLDTLLGGLVQCGPHALQVAKKLVSDLSWPEKRHALADHMEYVSRVLSDVRVSEEAQEGAKAFLEKRKPSWIP